MKLGVSFLLQYYSILFPVIVIYNICIYNENRFFLEECFVGFIIGVFIIGFMSLLPKNKKFFQNKNGLL